MSRLSCIGGVLQRLLRPIPVLLLLALSTVGAELWLAIRQEVLFNVSATRFNVIDSTGEVTLFFGSILLSHISMTGLLYKAYLTLFRRTGPAVLLLNFSFAYGAIYIIWLIARDKINSLLGDASLILIRDLSGGHLISGLIYVLAEADFVLKVLFLIGPIYIALRYVLKHGGNLSQEIGTYHIARRQFWAMWGVLLATPVFLYVSAPSYDVRIALDRFSAPLLGFAALEAISDIDGDGYSFFSLHRDQQPLDRSRHPFGLDIPGNGIDEDGLAGDYVHGTDSEDPPRHVFETQRRHAILIVLESTRADMLGMRWGGRLVAPNLAALAASGSYSVEAYSHAGYTRPSVKTLLTGRLDPATANPSLFTEFRDAGYRVVVLSGQAEDFGGIAGATGMRANSHLFIDAKVLRDESFNPGRSDITLALDNRVIFREFQRHLGHAGAWKRPTFLYVNVQASHYPYDTPVTPQMLPGRSVRRSEITFANRQMVRRSYWNTVAYADRFIGEIVQRLKQIGIYERTAIMVVADHGEELFEHGFIGHGQRLNDLQTRVPFVLSRKDVSLPTPIGLWHVPALLLQAAGADAGAGQRRGPVFQHTANLQRPTEIAMVEAGRRRTSMNLQNHEVVYAEADVQKLRGRYDRLPSGSPLRRRADLLVRMWERERWIHHLEQRKSSRP